MVSFFFSETFSLMRYAIKCTFVKNFILTNVHISTILENESDLKKTNTTIEFSEKNTFRINYFQSSVKQIMFDENSESGLIYTKVTLISCRV